MSIDGGSSNERVGDGVLVVLELGTLDRSARLDEVQLARERELVRVEQLLLASQSMCKLT